MLMIVVKFLFFWLVSPLPSTITNFFFFYLVTSSILNMSLLSRDPRLQDWWCDSSSLYSPEIHCNSHLPSKVFWISSFSFQRFLLRSLGVSNKGKVSLMMLGTYVPDGVSWVDPHPCISSFWWWNTLRNGTVLLLLVWYWGLRFLVLPKVYCRSSCRLEMEFQHL